MNLAARVNLQKGVAENKSYEWTNYSVESPLDAYLVQKHAMKQRYNEQRREAQQQEALEKYISAMVEEKLEDCLEKALGDVLKDFK